MQLRSVAILAGAMCLGWLTGGCRTRLPDDSSAGATPDDLGPPAVCPFSVPTLLASVKGVEITSMVVSGDCLYFQTFFDIRRVPRAGGDVAKVVASQNANGIAVANGEVYRAVFNPGGVAR